MYKKRGMGWNIHSSDTSDELWLRMLADFKVSKPGAILIFQGHNNDDGKAVARALQASRELPDTAVIYRKFLQGDHQQNYLTPQQWINEHVHFTGTRVFCSLNNEPNPEASVAFHLAVCKLARSAGIKVSIGGYSVGTPDDLSIFEPLLRYMAANPGWFILDLHEYTRALWTVDFARDAKNPVMWPTVVPRTQALWLMGRFRRWLDFCDSKGIPRPKIVIGEWGFDRVHAVPAHVYGDTQGIRTCEGTWRSWGYSDWVGYAVQQLRAAWRAIYQAYPEIIGVCFFQICSSTENWKEFNGYLVPGFYEATKEGFDTIMTTTSLPPFKPWSPATYTLLGPNGLRIRETPSLNGKELVQLAAGDVVTIGTAAAQVVDGHTWQPITGRGKTGWSSMDKTDADLKPYVPPVTVPPVTVPSPTALRLIEEIGVINDQIAGLQSTLKVKLIALKSALIG